MFAATDYSYKTLFEQHLNQSKSQRNVQWAFSNYRDLKSAAEIIKFWNASILNPILAQQRMLIIFKIGIILLNIHCSRVYSLKNINF